MEKIRVLQIDDRGFEEGPGYPCISGNEELQTPRPCCWCCKPMGCQSEIIDLTEKEQENFKKIPFCYFHNDRGNFLIKPRTGTMKKLNLHGLYKIITINTNEISTKI